MDNAADDLREIGAGQVERTSDIFRCAGVIAAVDDNGRYISASFVALRAKETLGSLCTRFKSKLQTDARREYVFT